MPNFRVSWVIDVESDTPIQAAGQARDAQMRGNYEYEIGMGEPQHSGTMARTVIYYLQRERRRPVIIVAKIWRALLRFFGVM